MNRSPSSRCRQLPELVLLPLSVVVAMSSFVALAAIAEQQPFPITLHPNCTDKCGDISIPYPFGVEPGCFLDGFQVTCNYSFHPGPRLFLEFNSSGGGSYQMMANASFDISGMMQNTSDPFELQPVELMNISLDPAEVRAYGLVRSSCLTLDGNYTFRRFQTTNLAAPFMLASGRNALVGVGWNVIVDLSGSQMFGTSTSATYLTCYSNTNDNPWNAKDKECQGLGCCQWNVTGNDYTFFGVHFSYSKPEDLMRYNGTSSCSYGMLVESPWYTFSKEDIFDYEVLPKKHPRGVPLVIDFAIRNGSCPFAGRPQPPDYACRSSNSVCANASSGGYVCKCLEHYDGNPYILNGCQDIDECALREKYPERRKDYPCFGICRNTPGGYDCACKLGMRGDGKAGTCTEQFPLPAKIAVGISALVVVLVLTFMVNQFLKLKKFYEQNGGPILEGVKNIRIYTRKQLKQITDNYRHTIGEGAFGKVYMGTLKNKQPVAIKKSIKVDEDRKKEFTDEVIIQSEMRHKNIVRLLGCCLELDVPMLVYEFVARGSLYDFLFKRRETVAVDTRLRIAIGSAEGLTYMHSAGESTIRHGDVKSANILLDEEFNPKISDFGTSSLLARGKAEMTERVIGDMSYIDPIYMERGVVTQKSDVYSFGIVLIELITRRAATYDEKRSYIANFVQAYQDNRARYFFDNDVTCEDDIKLLEMVSGVAVECLKPNPEERLDMKQVEHYLRGIIGQTAQHEQEGP